MLTHFDPPATAPQRIRILLHGSGPDTKKGKWWVWSVAESKVILFLSSLCLSVCSILVLFFHVFLLFNFLLRRVFLSCWRDTLLGFRAPVFQRAHLVFQVVQSSKLQVEATILLASFIGFARKSMGASGTTVGNGVTADPIRGVFSRSGDARLQVFREPDREQRLPLIQLLCLTLGSLSLEPCG